MLYQGSSLQLKLIENGVAELLFDAQNESVNKFDQKTLKELSEALDVLEKNKEVKGVLVTSGKAAFIVGADITEFLGAFSQPEDEIASWVLKINGIFNRLEDLKVPTLVAINGLALGGGLEVCLACDFRVMAESAQVGLPEVKLGIFPGFGGSVRMPRLIGVDNAVEWIAAGGQHKPAKALADHVVDAVAADDKLREVSLKMLTAAIEGKLDYQSRRTLKTSPLTLPPMENMMSFQSCLAMVKQQAGRHYPAPVTAVNTMQKHATMNRDKALEVEGKAFAQMAKTQVAENLVGLFLKDQAIKKNVSQWTKKARNVERSAVLGAGIMGGGIAYQSAYKGVPIIMKDIATSQLDLGMNEAVSILKKRVERKKMDPETMGKVLSAITPTLNYGDFKEVDVVIEAVVEKENVKKSVLAEVESNVKEGTILSSNTSTISITSLATALKKPENFVGMHFFNPVHMMPLVEVIRGEKSSDEAVATVVSLAKKMGKTPIVVNDCPGFLVNRVLFPYFGGFSMLVKDGVDFRDVDAAMEKWGWPMGPAYLTDVIGIDTCVHAAKVMADGFPERMSYDFKDPIKCVYEAERYGQKNKKGFYVYEKDRKGKLQKKYDESVEAIIKPAITGELKLEKDEIVYRMMIPMCLEIIRCLEEGIISSATDGDMAMLYGLGFPPFHGGPLKWVDTVGVATFVEICDRYADLGELYKPTEGLRKMAEEGRTFF
ncbi:MAG TPA: fatty acid oxidation complex subunit alpha FadB [Gammaproteobacteria bacterium]|nr:fatty acid oxidation complex subunit alpha FadB [Gammaproteobacteria bacterium]MEC8012082.1 fatty acid oxidation complex subunit alpha FadB [Pseudomonadota bacterium]HBF09960.1 fatty acid oxidation complex subunit alpha FadB [Gammaproteobacteria bacterium]HCK92350.1 fatty acid oxidation complex subunit alpha FadB [Gammaproteobacteria bacterium]|tara:strand:+ start:3132 stop:5276 length:2145 start_codon:yes stop_codon:yes gene_type:complete